MGSLTCEIYPPHSPAFINLLISHSLNKTRLQLVAMVQRQRDKWPWTDHIRKFNPSKTRTDILRSALLNPSFGFTLLDKPENKGASQTNDEGEELQGGTPGLGDDAEGSALVHSLHSSVSYTMCLQ
jgi:hypothetical protein